MIDAVFISDLHLHPCDEDILTRFEAFIRWAVRQTKVVYILGDLFHVCDGNEGNEPWTLHIAHLLKWLSLRGVNLYYLPGNRDFLINAAFIEKAGLTLLAEPSVITLSDKRLLLVHGDRYCTQDTGHMWLRRLTRNRLFYFIFLSLPIRLRQYFISMMRQQSQYNRSKPIHQLAINHAAMIKEMQTYQVKDIIYGHIHRPGIEKIQHINEFFTQYVLSDWDDNPTMLCYDKSKGLYLEQLLVA